MSLALCRSVPAHRAATKIYSRCMSVRPESNGALGVPERKKVTIQSLRTQKKNKTPITMLTAYDYATARSCSTNDWIDVTLVGDSLAQVCLGYTSTTQLTLTDMIHHARAVARGTTHPLLIADMPFGSYHASIEDTVKNAVQLIQHGHMEGVKMEGGAEIAEMVKRLKYVGIPVMAHVGLLPQRHLAMSGYRIQGKTVESATKVLRDALALEAAGAFAIVVEGVPKELGKYITDRLSIPTIGIGAGPWTDGQVLVWDDAVGTWSGHKAKFVRPFADIRSSRESAVERYSQAVRARSFPNEDSESYSLDQAEWQKFLETNST